MFLFFFFIGSTSAGYIDGMVSTVGVIYGSACATMDNGQVVKMDLIKETGRAEYSTVLAALASGKKVKIYQTDDPLVGGCNTGTTVKPHNILYIMK